MEDLLLPDQCKICDAKLTGPSQAVSHYGSERHKKKLEAFDLSYDAPIPQEYNCSLCRIKLKDNKSKCEHVASFPHNELSKLKTELLRIGIKDQYWVLDNLSANLEFANITCSICNVTSPCERNFLDHIYGSKHKRAFTNWKNSPSRNLVNEFEYMYNRFYCKSCDKTLDGTNEADYHYDEKSHLDLEAEKINSMNMTPKKTGTNTPENGIPSLHKIMEFMLLPGECKICDIKLPGPSQVESHCASERHRKKIEAFQLSYNASISQDYYCSLCSIELKDAKSKCEHVDSFPHKELITLKSELIKIGVKDQYWTVEDLSTKSISCCICNVTPSGQKNFLDHIHCSRHIKAFTDWKMSPSRNLVNEFESKYNRFYCKTCDKMLDGTNEADYHYCGKSHLDLETEKIHSTNVTPKQTGTNTPENGIPSPHKIMEFMLLPGECKICDIKLPGPSQVESHCASERHRKKLEAFQLSYNASISQDYYCSLCSIELKDEKSKREHVDSFPHKELITLKSELIKIGVKDQYWTVDDLSTKSISCSICNVTPSGQKNFLDHIHCSRHIKAFTDWKMSPSRNLVNEFESKYNRFYCKTCDKMLDGTNEADYHYCGKSHLDLEKEKNNLTNGAPKQTGTNTPENGLPSLYTFMKDMEPPEECKVRDGKLTGQPHYVSEQHRKNAPPSSNVAASKESYYCNVCRTDLKDKKCKCEHIASFPHKELIILKAGLIKIGISDEFWRIEQPTTMSQPPTITCLLCNVTSVHQKNFLDHINGYKHREVYFGWIISPSINQLNPLEDDKNCFYCQMCDKVLDGTNDAANHYTGKSHLKLQKKTCNSPTALCDSPSWSSSQTLKEPSLTTENKSVSEQISLKAASIQALENENRETNTQYLKQQVFNELEKLVQKLYYSQSVPYDTALKLLKKMNQDVEDLAKEHEKPEEIVQTNNESINRTLSNGDISHKFPNSERKQSSTAPVTSAATSLNQATNQTPSNGEINNKSSDTKTVVQRKEDISSLTSVQSPAGGCSNQIPSNVETSSRTTATVKDIPDLIQQIVERREEIEKNCNGNNASLEKELLQEIEVFLKQIVAGDIPLDLLLHYLEDCNKLLELLSEPPDQQSIGRNNVMQMDKQFQAKKHILPENGISLVEVNVENVSSRSNS